MLLPQALAAGYSIYYYTSILHSKLFLLVFFFAIVSVWSFVFDLYSTPKFKDIYFCHIQIHITSALDIVLISSFCMKFVVKIKPGAA